MAIRSKRLGGRFKVSYNKMFRDKFNTIKTNRKIKADRAYMDEFWDNLDDYKETYYLNHRGY